MPMKKRKTAAACAALAVVFTAARVLTGCAGLPVRAPEPTEESAKEPGTFSEPVLQSTGFLYYEEHLPSAEERAAYAVVYDAIVGYKTEVLLPIQSEEEADAVFESVMADHPEIFYVDGYYLKRSEDGLHFTGGYTKNEVERDAIAAELEKKRREITDSAPDGDDYEKIKHAYDAIAESTSYDVFAPDNQNIVSVFLNHSSVCQGYSKAFQWVLLGMGVPCVLDTGTANGAAHSWNVCRSNGRWYYVDLTWGRTLHQSDECLGEVNYDYFMVTQQEIEKTHVSEACVKMPGAYSMSDNYYVREGTYLSAYSASCVENIVKRESELRSDGYVCIKCADEEVYESAYRDLIEDKAILGILSSDEISYKCFEDLKKLVFILR